MINRAVRHGADFLDQFPDNKNQVPLHDRTFRSAASFVYSRSLSMSDSDNVTFHITAKQKLPFVDSRPSRGS